MPHYVKRTKGSESGKPEVIKEKETIVERVVEVPSNSQDINIEALANAVAQAINIQLPKNISQGGISSSTNIDDSFDDSKTINKLAEQMLVERGDSKANFDNLGNVKTTKRDQKEVDSTIDLLSKLND